MAYYARYEPDETGTLQKVVYNCGVGFCLPFYGETAPPGTLACDGSEISREAYTELFQVLGTKAGAGDGVSTFNLPDFRGDFIRCVGGNAAELGVEQGDAIREITGQIGYIQEAIFNYASGVFAGIPPTGSAGNQTMVNGSQTFMRGDFTASRVVPTAVENRPVNVALLWCIIYE